MSQEISLFNIFDLMLLNFNLSLEPCQWSSSNTIDIAKNTNDISEYDTPHDRICAYLKIIQCFLLTGDIVYNYNDTICASPIIKDASPGFVNNLYRNETGTAECISRMLTKGYEDLYKALIQILQQNINSLFIIANGKQLPLSITTKDNNGTIIYLTDILSELELFITILSHLYIFDCRIIRHHNYFSGGYTTLGCALRYVDPAKSDSKWETANYVISPYSLFKVFNMNSYDVNTSSTSINVFNETSLYDILSDNKYTTDYIFNLFLRKLYSSTDDNNANFKTLIYNETDEITPSIPFDISHKNGSNGSYAIYHDHNKHESNFKKLIPFDIVNLLSNKLISRSQILTIIDTIFEIWLHNITVSSHILHTCHYNCHGNNTRSGSVLSKSEVIRDYNTSTDILPYYTSAPVAKHICEVYINVYTPVYDTPVYNDETHITEYSLYDSIQCNTLTPTDINPSITFSPACIYCPQQVGKILYKYTFKRCAINVIASHDDSEIANKSNITLVATYNKLALSSQLQYSFVVDDTTPDFNGVLDAIYNRLTSDANNYPTTDRIYTARLSVFFDIEQRTSELTEYNFNTEGYSIFMNINNNQAVFYLNDYVGLTGNGEKNYSMHNLLSGCIQNAYIYTQTSKDIATNIGDTTKNIFCVTFANNGINGLKYFKEYRTFSRVKYYSTRNKTTNVQMLSTNIFNQVNLTKNPELFGSISASTVSDNDIVLQSYPTMTYNFISEDANNILTAIPTISLTSISSDNVFIYFNHNNCNNIYAKIKTMPNTLSTVNLYSSQNNTFSVKYWYEKNNNTELSDIVSYSLISAMHTNYYEKTFETILALARNNYVKSDEPSYVPYMVTTDKIAYMPCNIFKFDTENDKTYSITLNRAMSLYAKEATATMKIYNYHWCLVPLYAFNCANTVINISNTATNALPFIWGTNNFSKDYTFSCKLNVNENNISFTVTSPGQTDTTITIDSNRALTPISSDPKYLHTVLLLLIGSNHSPIGHVNMQLTVP